MITTWTQTGNYPSGHGAPGSQALKAAGRNLPRLTASDLNNFKDAGSVSDYAKESMAILVKSGIIVGYNNMLYPKGKFDMQQAATVIYRLYTED